MLCLFSGIAVKYDTNRMYWWAILMLSLPPPPSGTTFRKIFEISIGCSFYELIHWLFFSCTLNGDAHRVGVGSGTVLSSYAVQF